MASIQTLRAILVAGAALAGVLGLVTGQTTVAVFMALAVTIHLVFSSYLRRRLATAPAVPPAEPIG